MTPTPPEDLIAQLEKALEQLRIFGWHIDAGDDWDQPRVLNQKGHVVATCEDSDAGKRRAEYIVAARPEAIRTLLDSYRTAERSSKHWAECFSVLSRAVIGETGLSAIDVASELRARAEAAAREVERLTADSARLEWLMSRGARVVWHGKDSEFCSVWLPGTWDGDPERQVTGLHVEAREAIDEARRARQALEAPHGK